MPVTREDMRVVERVASRFTRHMPDHLGDDVRSDGMFALAKAVEDWETTPYWRYEFTRAEFIAGRVRRAMIDGFRERNGHKSTGYRKQKFEEGMLRLDSVTESDTREESFLDRFAGQRDLALEDVGTEEMLARLPKREREVVVRHVLEGETQSAIGESLGVHESRVNQLLHRAYARLRGENTLVTISPRRSLLTNRELEIIHRVSEGQTNVEIAGALAVSEETIKSHMRHILSKLSARSRAHAVAISVRRGLID